MSEVLEVLDKTALRVLVDRVCDEMGLNRWDGNTVEAWVQQKPITWGQCCGSDGCDPCNGVLAEAARRVLRALKEADAAATQRPERGSNEPGALLPFRE